MEAKGFTFSPYISQTSRQLAAANAAKVLSISSKGPDMKELRESTKSLMDMAENLSASLNSVSPNRPAMSQKQTKEFYNRMIVWQQNKKERLEKKANEKSARQLEGVTFTPEVNQGLLVIPRDVKKNNLEY